MAKGIKIDFEAVAARTVGLGAGAMAANMANNLPFVSTIDPRLVAGGKFAVGTAISVYMGAYNKKSTVGEALQGFGDGMASIGFSDLVAALLPAKVSGLIKGVGAFPPMIKGATEMIVIPENSTIKGVTVVRPGMDVGA